MAVGISPTALNANTRFVEFYDASNNTWSLGPNPRALRRQPEALILPDGRVLAFGGQYSGPTPAPVPLANAGTIPNCTKVCDLYDPANDSWRPLADLNRYIHYHNVTVLVPDGRVIATGGAGLTANNSFAGDDMSIEAYEPPYLFRGVRPRIDWLSTTDFVLGSNFTLRVSLTERITKLVLVSARATTHWVDGGPQRYLMLDFTHLNLCRLLSRHAEGAENDEASVAAKQRQPLKRSWLAQHNDGPLAVSSDSTLAEFFAGRFYRAATQREGDIACPAIHYAKPEDRRRYDILQSVRTLTLLEHNHPDKRSGGRFHFRTPTEFGAMCAQHPEWIRATHEIADRCEFTFPFGKPQFPAFVAPDGSTSSDLLRRLVLDGLRSRYGGKRIVSDTGADVPLTQVRAQVEKELSIIA